MPKELIPEKVQESILSTEQVGKVAFAQFVEQRITGGGNLWDRMTKVKLLTWNAAAKEIKMKTGSEVTTLKATFSLFARVLLVARTWSLITGSDSVDKTFQKVKTSTSKLVSSREEVIGTHEFSHTNGTLMQAEGTLHPTNDKSSVIHLLEGLVYTVTASDEASSSEEHSMTILIVDGMAVIQ